MSKRSVFTTLTPLPAGISRETVLETLHDHLEMVDLNPLVEERHPIKPPSNSTPEEYHCLWYSLTDRVSYLPGGLMTGKVNYNACFHDLENGLQTHCYAPMGLDIRGKWTVGGSLPGEPIAPVELGVGAPVTGLWLREDVDMRCNIVMTSFVKKTLKKAHSRLVDRLVIKAQIVDATLENQRLSLSSGPLSSALFSASQSSIGSSQSDCDYNSSLGLRSSSPFRNPFPPRQSLSTSTSSTSSSGLGLSVPFENSNENTNTLHAHAQIQSAGRNSTSSWANSQRARNSYQDNRVSWQSLNQTQARRSPSPSSLPAPLRAGGGEFQKQDVRRDESGSPYKPYQPPAQNYHAVELHSEDKYKQGSNQYYRGQAQRPTVFSAVELE